MQVVETDLPEVFMLEPKVFGDERGFFMDSYNKRILSQFGIGHEFVQDNHSRSAQGVLRGLHYQIEQAQGKLVRVVSGEVFDVAVDIRRSSAAFGRWAGMHLSAANKRLAWIPPGFAHGFLVLSETADFLYKTTDYYAPEHERAIRWNDPDLAIDWPIEGMPTVSQKDAAGAVLAEADLFP